MPASSATTGSAPTSGTCFGTWRASIRRPSMSCCAVSADCQLVGELGENFRAVPEASPGYSIREQITVPRDLRRERADLFHAPHYVLPPLTPCKSVVTIHDCIHLRFPQYLPNRLGYAYARALAVDGDASVEPHPDGVGGVEAGHPRLLQRAAGEDRRHLQRHRRTLQHAAAGGRCRARARALPARRSVHPLCRQHQAAQEHRADDRSLPSAPARRRVRAGQARHHRRRDRQVRRASTRRPSAQAAQVRAVLRLRPRSHARDPLSPRGRVRVSVPLRGLRAAAARGHGERHAGHHLERLVAPRGRRRRGAARRPASARGDCRRDAAGPDRRDAQRRPCARGLDRARHFSWERSIRRVREIYGEVLAT